MLLRYGSIAAMSAAAATIRADFSLLRLPRCCFLMPDDATPLFRYATP